MINLKNRIILTEKGDDQVVIKEASELKGDELLITIRSKINLLLTDALFFGKQILIVEGYTDYSHIYYHLHEILENENISVWSIGGSNKIPLKLKEFEEEGILDGAMFLLDSDEEGIKVAKESKKLIHDMGYNLPIMMLRGIDIEDYYSSTDFYNALSTVLSEDQMKQVKLHKPSTNKIDRGRFKDVCKLTKLDCSWLKIEFLKQIQSKNPDEDFTNKTQENFSSILSSIIKK